MKTYLLLTFLSVLGVVALMVSCKKKETQLTITRAPYGSDAAGAEIELFTLTNAGGMKVVITNFGGKIVSIIVPDKNEKMDDIVLGYNTYPEWEKGNPYFGALIGRYGNRIAKGKFSIDGKQYQLAQNNGQNALHGGPDFGFHNIVWAAEEIKTNTETGVKLSYLSPDGQEGYPGNLAVNVTYLLNNQNELTIKYSAQTDQPTPINLTHHSFFNLAGADSGDILEHQLMINADAFTPVDETLIPTGEIRLVANTPFDFSTSRAIGERIAQDDIQLKYGNGYDHNFVLNKNSNKLELAATVIEPRSGRCMDVLTTEPGLQFYSGNFLDGTDVGKGGKPYQFRTAFCLETQHFPDSPNIENFPNTILRPGDTYTSETVYRFYCH
ncbi:MAG: galactose mutarotase [Holophagaceae bacterium]|nr:galactose mutarotase [Holophagaceae bacterium]